MTQIFWCTPIVNDPHKKRRATTEGIFTQMEEGCGPSLGPSDVDDSLLGTRHLFQRLLGKAEIPAVQRLPASQDRLKWVEGSRWLHGNETGKRNRTKWYGGWRDVPKRCVLLGALVPKINCPRSTISLDWYIPVIICTTQYIYDQNDRDVSIQGRCVTRDDYFGDQGSQNIHMGTHCFGTSRHPTNDMKVRYKSGSQ